MVEAEVDYDEDLDILSIDKVDSKVEYSIGEDIIIFDFDKKKNIVGVEILDFSKITGISKNKVRNIRDGSIRISHRKSEKTWFICIEFKLAKDTNKVVMPIEANKLGIDEETSFEAILV